MAKDSDGTQNQPLFSETGAPQIGTDLSLVSNYAALVGNRKVGTTAQRTALTGADRWTGMAFFDTTLNYEFYWDGAAWAGGPTLISDISSITTMGSGFTFSNGQASYVGGVCTIRLHATRSGSSIAGGTSGNITNTLIATITDTTLWPLHTAALSQDTSGIGCSYYIDTAGGIYLATLPPNGTVNTSDSVSCSGSYVRDVLS